MRILILIPQVIVGFAHLSSERLSKFCFASELKKKNRSRVWNTFSCQCQFFACKVNFLLCKSWFESSLIVSRDFLLFSSNRLKGWASSSALRPSGWKHSSVSNFWRFQKKCNGQNGAYSFDRNRQMLFAAKKFHPRVLKTMALNDFSRCERVFTHTMP